MTRRFFNEDERFALWTVSGQVCESCKETIDRSFHADHKIPYSRGGQTDLSNAQALCADCNLKKGNRVSMPLKLRKWQEGCLRKIEIAYANGQRDFLATACPGAGKSPLSLTFVKQGKETGAFDFTIVVVPTASLKDQWMESAYGMGLEFRTDMKNKELKYGEPEDIDGLCLTYSQVVGAPLVQALICQRKRVLVILDEVHHASEDKSWGKALFDAFCDATFRLLLSGTPFRSDSTAIPFVRYDADGYCVPDYTYGYGRAVADGVCRALVFPHYDGQMDWVDGVDLMRASFLDDLDKVGESRRLLTALHPSGTLLRNMLARAHEKLMSIRLHGDHENAAGLVVVKNKEHAEQVATWMRKSLKVDPVVVHCDDKEAGVNIRKFKKSTEPWIIAINMISEGVDIPRLRVGVYATNKITLMFFLQVIARVVRMTEGLEEQTAYFYIPADKRIMDMAISVEKEVYRALIEREPGTREPVEPRDPGLPFAFKPIDAHGDENGHIASEIVFQMDEIEHVRQIQLEQPEFLRIPEASIARLLRKYTGFSQEPVHQPTASSEPVGDGTNPNTEFKRLRTLANTLVSRFRETYPEDRRPSWDDAHNMFNRPVGIKTTATASRDQLRAKIDLIQDRLSERMPSRIRDL